LLKILGVAGTAGVAGELTLGELEGEVTTAADSELASMGEAIRADLSGTLDTALLASGIEGLLASTDRLPVLEAAGLPAERGTAYRELTDEIWPLHRHLVEVGFFGAAQRHLPPFTQEHISATARNLVATGTLGTALGEAGFDRTDRTSIAATIANNDAHLAKWQPVEAYTDQGIDDFDPADIAPLHQRATEGALLWIDGLDHWLWQTKVLLTEEMLADGIWDIKTMLGGYYLVAQAAHGTATGDIADDQLSALTTAGSAAAIVGQEHLAEDLVRITDDKRAPAPRQGGVN